MVVPGLTESVIFIWGADYSVLIKQT